MWLQGTCRRVTAGQLLVKATAWTAAKADIKQCIRRIDGSVLVKRR